MKTMRAVWCVLLFVLNAVAFDFINIPTLEEFLQEPLVTDDRIVGGQDAEIVNHPYQVAFIFNQSYFCGGFIVSERYIVTAAHCAKNVDPSTVVLRAGSSWRRNGTLIPIEEVKSHPEYDNPAFDKDVAVLKTKDSIPFSETIQPIDLPPEGRHMKAGSEVIVSGWGRIEQGGDSLPDKLMEVQIPVVAYPTCFLSYMGVMTRNMWCGGNFVMGGQGTCQGDSGGAAIQDGMAVGIVSYGRGCGQSFNPSVFADIASKTIRDFIKEHTGL